MTDKQYALKISFVYFMVGALWIFLSDSFAATFFSSKTLMFVSMIKGWVFVSGTTLLIYAMSNQYIGKLSKANYELQENITDLTAMHEELVATEEDLRQQYHDLYHLQTQNAALLKAIPDLMLRISNSGVFLDYKESSCFPLYLAPEQFIGQNIRDVFPADFVQNALWHIEKALSNNGVQFFEYELLEKNHMHHYEARFVQCGPDEVLVIIRDITDRKKMEQDLKYLGLHDVLTSTYNRTYFEAELLKIASENNNGAGIISCDVDGLKLINDTLGHRAGDELLQLVARLLNSCIAEPDFVARVGGDEFAVLIFAPNQQKMTSIANAIKNAVTQYNKNNPQLPLSLSIGWAIDSTSNNIDTLLKEADNNMYREKMHQSLSSKSAIVQAMMQALEARDYITEGHANRLQSLIEAICYELQLPGPTIADLRLLAKFHDIGKVGIPDAILFKPDRLTEDETAIMRRHCEIGFRIAKSANDLAPIAECILKHQEWWNGQGYPLGAAGEEIPLPCRILAIADAFDAMTNTRPYRPAMKIQDAVKELRRCAGTQFDPNLIEVFITVLQKQQIFPSDNPYKFERNETVSV